MKKVILIILLVVGVWFFLRFVIGGDEDTWICDKEKGEWVRHGNPSAAKPTSGCGEKKEEISMEEVCNSETGKQMTFDKASQIAKEKCKDGTLKETHFCNPNSGTWWIDFSPNQPKEGCNPACVIFVDTAETEINWRCTGLIEQ